jgi:MFS family permease
MTTEKSQTYDVLKIPDFGKFLFGRFFVTISIQMTAVIVGWQIYQITKDPMALGLLGLAEAASFFAVAMFAGHVADIVDRRKILIITNFLLLLGGAALLLLSLKQSHILRDKGVFPIYTVMFFLGAVRGFVYPANVAIAAQIVPRSMYPRSSAWTSLVWQIAAVSGPAIGGLIYGFFGVSAAYVTAICSALVSFAAFLNIRSYPITGPRTKEPILKSLSTGIRFVFKHQLLLSAMSLDMFAVLFGGALAILPMFAADVLNTGPKGLGFLRAAPAAGAMIMSLWLAHHPPVKSAGKKLLWVVAGFGLCMAGFALSRNFYLAFLMLALSGLFDNISVVIRSTIVQLYTPDNMRGRVASVNSVFIGSSNEIGAFESGAAAKLLGLVPSLLFNSGMTLAVAGTVAKLAPKLRKLDLREHLEQTE